MPRKRKQPIIEEQSDNGECDESAGKRNSSIQHGPMYTIMSNAQLNETFHNKYIKEMQQLYLKMDHDAFMYTFIRMIKSAMEPDETNEYAQNTLLFCAKFISSYNGDDTHPVLDSIFHWLLSTTSSNAHIRYRLCQFVNLVLNSLGLEAALDDSICDNIMTYMINRLQDLHPNIRVQAILALQRLQIPDNPDDIVIKTYQFHLSADPSPRVRMAVITSMGRNYNTIPYILERLWDIDEKVRRHTYFQMSTFSAKAYKVSQRLTFLEQGLNDRSEMVRKVVTTVMLPQWLESYSKNIIAFISSLKLDANEAEMDRFRKITKVALREVFKREKVDDLIENLPIVQDGEFKSCIPLDELSVENTLYWLCLIEYLQNEAADEVDLIIPELMVFCQYVQKYCESAKLEMDKWQKMEYQYILLTLMEITYTFDLGDEIGRENLKQLLMTLLKNFEIESHTVEIIVRIAENLMCEQEERLQYFVDIINDILEQKTWQPNSFSHDRSLIDELLEKQPDKSLKLKLSSLKVKILDLEEQERIFVERKDYVKAQEIADEKNVCNDEYSNLLQPILDQISSKLSNESTRKSLSCSLRQAKKVTSDTILKCLQIAFHMVVSKKVKSLTPIVCELYREFIRRHIASNQISIRDWALKCGTAYSMLYDQLSKDVYVELYSQFYKNHNTRIWKVSIDCIFELIDRYGLSHFELEDKQNKSRKPGRQLYNSLEFFDGEEDVSTAYGQGVDLVFMMSHFLDTCDDVGIIVALVNGFCRLILHGRIENNGIVEKLVLKYFNPVIDPEINQILGVFFENLISKKKQDYLQSCLLPTISTIMSASYEDPLHEIKPETVIRFVVQSTQPMYCRPGVNIHNKIAESFLQEMQNSITNKELIKILAKELVTLEISVQDNDELKMDFIERCEELLQAYLDSKITKYLNIFKEILQGNSGKRVRSTNEGVSDEENYELSADEDENRNIALEQNKENTNQQAESALVSEKETNVKELQTNKTVENVSENTSLVTNTEGNANLEAGEKKDDASNTKDNSEESDMEKSKNPENLDGIEKSNVENAEKTNTTVIDENLEKTPTTFGRDNTTDIRYLRKSLNAKRSATDISPCRPHKRRIQIDGTPLVNGISINQKKTEKKRDGHNKTSSDLEPTEQKSNSKHNKNSLKSKKIFDAVPNTPLGVTSTSHLNDESITIPETQGSPLSLSNKETDNLQKSKVQRSDDESIIQNSSLTSEAKTKKGNKTRIETSENISSRRSSRLTSKSAQLPTKSSSLINKSDVRTRQLSFSALPASDKIDSNSKQSRKTIEIFDLKEKRNVENPLKARTSNEKTPEKEISALNSSDKRKRNMDPSSKYILTKSTEKRILASKNPTIKLARFKINANGMTTRSAKKKENAFNTVLTRRQRSLDKIPVGLESAIILSSKKNIPSNHTTPEKSEETRGEKITTEPLKRNNRLPRNVDNVKSKTNVKQLKNGKSTTTLAHSKARRKL